MQDSSLSLYLPNIDLELPTRMTTPLPEGGGAINEAVWEGEPRQETFCPPAEGFSDQTERSDKKFDRRGNMGQASKAESKEVSDDDNPDS